MLKFGSIGLAVVIAVVFFGWICWFCQKRRKNKQENQVQTELSEKDRKGNTEFRGLRDYLNLNLDLEGNTEFRGLRDYTSPSDQRSFAKYGVDVKVLSMH